MMISLGFILFTLLSFITLFTHLHDNDNDIFPSNAIQTMWRRLHLFARIRSKSQLWLHKFWYFRMGFSIRFSSYDTGFLGEFISIGKVNMFEWERFLNDEIFFDFWIAINCKILWKFLLLIFQIELFINSKKNMI